MIPLFFSTFKHSKFILIAAFLLAFCMSFSYEPVPEVTILEKVFQFLILVMTILNMVSIKLKRTINESFF